MEETTQQTAFQLVQLAQLGISFIGGGLLTTIWVQRSNKRREMRQFVYSRIEDLTKSYQRYVRLLRSQTTDNSAIEIDNQHADFLAAARMMTLMDKLEKHHDPLRSIAKTLANLRHHELDKETRDKKLSEVSERFQSLIKQVLFAVK